MRTILTLSHNGREVEYEDAWPVPHPPSRRLQVMRRLENGDVVTVMDMDLFDVVLVTWLP